MPEYSRRAMILGTAAVGAAGAGVTAAAGGLSGSVEGQADVQAEQALTVTEVDTVSGGDQDASFTRVSDDNTEFQAAVELNNGDTVGFDVVVENSAQDDLDVQVAVDSPDPFDIDVRHAQSADAFNADRDIDPDDNGSQTQSSIDGAVQTGEGTFIATIEGSGNDTDAIGIFAELDDDADPGSYDIGVAINPLSTDN